MTTPPPLPFWKDKLLPSILGALVGALLTQGVALYTLSKSLQVAQNRDRIQQLRASISALYSLQTEFDKNTQMLIADRVELKFTEERKQIEVLAIKDPVVREFAKAFASADGDFYTLQSLTVPRQYFSAQAWNPVGGPLPEASLELAKDLSDFYSRLQKMNTSIEESKNVFRRWGRVVPASELDNLRRVQKVLTEEVAYVSKDRITDLASRVLTERKKLEEVLARLDR